MVVENSGGLLLLGWETGIGSCFGKEVSQYVIAIALDKRAMVRSYVGGLEESYIGTLSQLGQLPYCEMGVSGCFL